MDIRDLINIVNEEAYNDNEDNYMNNDSDVTSDNSYERTRSFIWKINKKEFNRCRNRVEELCEKHGIEYDYKIGLLSVTISFKGPDYPISVLQAIVENKPVPPYPKKIGILHIPDHLIDNFFL